MISQLRKLSCLSFLSTLNHMRRRTEDRQRSIMSLSGWCLLATVIGVISISVILDTNFTGWTLLTPPVPGPPGKIIKKYEDALEIALMFLEIQKSGKLENNTIPWRGDSALKDGSQAKLDLSKGMFDAGDCVKFGFPMAFTATLLSWAILEYGDQMEAVDQLKPAQKSLKWITDYLVNAHPKSDVLYVQVGDGAADHSCWNRPEDMQGERPLAQVNSSAPGSDVAAETSAALASASLVFKPIDRVYSSLLLRHAKQLFSFADKYREVYSVSVAGVGDFYNSTAFGDELLWAASWLYHATEDMLYFEYVTGVNGIEFGNFGNPMWFSWDHKLPGVQVLLSRVALFGPKGIARNDVLQKYRSSAEAVICGLLPDSPTATSSRTKAGLIWVSDWNPLLHPVASAFLAVMYSDYMLTSRTSWISCSGKKFSASDIRKFAISQIDYVLGDNPMEMSYLVGYGDKFPEYVHHRGASIPANTLATCKEGFKWLHSDKPNPNVATGALVGGPFLNDTYIDTRLNVMHDEPTTYNSAALIALLSALLTTSSIATSFT